MTRTLDLNDQNHDARLVVQGQFRPEGPWEARVSRSVGAFEPGRVGEGRFGVTDATIEVFRGDQRLGTITRDSLNRYTADAFVPRPEATYRVRVSAPGLDPVEATDRVPALPPSRLSVEEDPSQGEEGWRTLRLTIEDPPSVENYYGIVLERITETDDGIPIRRDQYFRTQNRAILEEVGGGFELEGDNTYSGSTAFFTDVLFDGQTYTIDLEVQTRAGSRDQPVTPTYELQVRALSSDTYSYLRTQHLASETDDNPFASPVDVEGNVEGGYGLMGAMNIDTLRQDFE